MRRPHRILRDVGTQATGNYLATVLRIVRGLVVAGVLGPSQMGIVATANLVLNYSQYTDLGITQAVGRELPMALGRGNRREADSWSWYAIVAQALAGLVLTIILCGLLLTPAASGFTWAQRVIVVVVGLTTILTGEFLALQTIGKGRREFRAVSTMLVLYAACNFVCGVIGARAAGAVGVVVGVFISNAVAVAWAWTALRPSGYRGIEVERIRVLFAIGWPLALLTFVGFNLENIDQVMILWLLDRTQLGLYSIVLQAGGLLTLTGLSVSGVVGPRLLAVYAREGTIESIRRYTWEPAIALSAVLPLLVTTAWLVGTRFITWLLPEYVGAIPAFRIYLVGMYFLTVNLGTSTALLAMRKHVRTVPLMLGAIVFNIAVDLALVGRLGMGIGGIALASLLTYLLYWALNSTMVRWYFEGSVLAAVASNSRLAWPGLVLVVMLVSSAAMGVLANQSVVFDVAAMLVALVVGFVQAWPMRRELLSLIGGSDDR